MAGDDLLDAYIAEALKSTGTRKGSAPETKPPAPERPAPPANAVPAARPRSVSAQPHSVPARTSSQTRPPVVGRTPTPSAVPAPSRTRTASTPPVVARAHTPSIPPTFDDSPLSSIDRARPPKPTPPPPMDRMRTPTAPPAIARTRSASASPLALARTRDLAAVDPLPRERAPHASSSHIPQSFDDDFSEDTVPEAQAITALTDQDDRGVRRS